jgi:predicted transcriptional regulator
LGRDLRFAKEQCTAKASYDIVPAMTKDQVKEVLDRVLTWPQERQEDAAQMLLALEAQEGELYHPSDDESTAIEEGLAQAKRGEAVTDDEIAALFKPRGP